METNDILGIGSIDFAPDWARKEAGVTAGAGGESRGGGRAEGVPQAAEGREPRQGGGRGPFRPAGGGGREPRRGGDGAPRHGGARRPAQAPERTPFPFEIKLLPEPKALGTIIRKLQQEPLAYKLRDLAMFLLDNPASIHVKLVHAHGAEGENKAAAGSAAPKRLFQCKACGCVAPDREGILRHISQVHLADYYDAVEKDCEKPSGNFNCVAKCGLDGVFLGPPNLHGFNEIVRDRIRRFHPQMSEAEYRSHIIMVREPEAIEQWRESAVKKTVYVAKGGGEGAAPLAREQAEGEMLRNIAPSLVDQPKTVLVPADVALESRMPGLAQAVRAALEAERRFPAAICFALRGAFHHRKLNFFRVNDSRGYEFVTGVELKEFDAAHAIPELAQMAAFIAAHPCATKSDIVASEEDAKHLAWLVSTGHVVSFTNGVYSAVEKFPKYGPEWQKWRKTAQKKEEAPAVPETTAAEAPETTAAEEPETTATEEPETTATEEKKDETPTELA